MTRDVDSMIAMLTASPPGSRGEIDLDLALAVRRIANALGEKAAAARLDISAVTLVRVAGCWPIQAMSADVLRQRVAVLECEVSP